uniref:Variable lymphocyte receptor B cassette n=1 Tax=Petromyzon marinus TaxID=7757 RepID=S4RTX9_PETMA
DKLDLNSNSLATLSDTAFRGLTKLTWLNLQYNALKSLPPRVFDSLTKLTILYLQDNQLETSLPPRVFDSLTKLTNLELQRIQLEGISQPVFGKLTAVARLYLTYNQLKSLPPRVFDSLTKLTILYLHSNQLESTLLSILYLSDFIKNNAEKVKRLLSGSEYRSEPDGVTC